jgi:hypothetical protein
MAVLAGRLKLSLNSIETQCLQMWLAQVSNTTFTDKKTQNAMRDLLEKIEHEITIQQPQWDCKFDYGDF